MLEDKFEVEVDAIKWVIPDNGTPADPASDVTDEDEPTPEDPVAD